MTVLPGFMWRSSRRALWALCLVGTAAVLSACAGSLTDGLRYTQTTIDPSIAEHIQGVRNAARTNNGVIFSGSNAPPGTLSGLEKGSDQFSGQSNWQPQAETGTNGTITLNLVDVPIADAAKVVLADTLSANYVLDPAVTGTVTMQTNSPVTKDTLVAIFETVLRSKGAALIEDNGFYKIVPATQANGAGVRINTGTGGSDEGGSGTQLQVVPLAHVAAAEMAEILKPMVASGGVVRADTTRNLLILRGTRSELDAMLQAVQIFDVDWMKGKSFGLFRVEFADPVDIVHQLDEVFANEIGKADKGVVRFIPNRALKSVLVISARAEFLNKADTWIKRFDTLGGANDKRTYIYHIQFRPAVELATLLQKVFASKSVSKSNANAPAPALDSAQNIPSGAAAPPATGDAPPAGDQTAALTQAASLGTALPSRDATGASDASQGAEAQPIDNTSDVSVVADESNNSVLIMAKPRDYQKILAILKSIDTEANQVLLEATIMEVSLDDELKYGLRWFFQHGEHGSFSFSDLANGAVIPQFPGFSYFLNADSIKVALSALANITDVNVISSPSLMVMDNHKATLQVGDEVPIATQQAVGVQVTGAPIVNAISFKNTGVILNVTPRISNNGNVVLDIEQEVSNVVKTSTSGIDSPTIQQRKIHTTVSVADGQGLTLGGLIQERDNLTKEQIPLAGDIPVIGNLFKHKDDQIKRTELLIIITPRVVRNMHQANAITDEFRERIDLSLRPNHTMPPKRRENVDRLLVR